MSIQLRNASGSSMPASVNAANNPGIGIGRLRVIGPEWEWVGMSSAP